MTLIHRPSPCTITEANLAEPGFISYLESFKGPTRRFWRLFDGWSFAARQALVGGVECVAVNGRPISRSLYGAKKG